ncbi:MAG: hypothetical protein IJY04_07185, partial [Clostridia bacterium]|nr:hypothetical protein [Clostridia bacterium]
THAGDPHFDVIGARHRERAVARGELLKAIMQTELLHKNGKGGKLFELSKQAAEIEKKLILSAESTQRASVAKAEIEHTEAQLLNLERKQAEARNILISKRRQELKNRLNELSSLNDEKKRLSGEVLRINHGGISRKELKNANSTKASRIPFSFIAILLASLSVICGIMPFTPFFAGFTALFPLCAVLFSSSLVLFCIAGMSKTRAKHSLISTINDRIARIELRIAELRGQLTAFSASEIEEASRDTTSQNTDALLDTTEPIEALELAHSETMAKLNDMKLRYASEHSSDSNTENLHSELDRLKNEISALKLRYDALELAQSTLKKADDTLKRDVLPRLSARAGELFSLFTEQKYNGIGMESDERGLRLTYRDKSGFSDAIYLSHGSGELAWLCIRLAIWELSGDHRIPLILDECFAFYDDRRMCATLSHLLSLSENGAQIFVFSANGRELSVLRNNCHFISI